MSTIPVSVTEEQFKEHIQPQLNTAKRGYVSRIPLHKIFNYILYRLHTGCQWKELPIERDAHDPSAKEISWWAVYHHFRKWSREGSLERVWQHSVQLIRDEIDPSVLNLDGSHATAKKGGEAVAYQGRKKAKTSNILPITDQNGYILATTDIVAGNHHDAFNLKPQLQAAFTSIKRLGVSIEGAYFNADSGFDTLDARKVCFNHHVIPNIAENKRNRKSAKLGRKRLFDATIYKDRFASERTFAWIDKFRALLVRFDIKKIYFMGSHFLAFALINMRNLFAS
jgi:transposase